MAKLYGSSHAASHVAGKHAAHTAPAAAAAVKKRRKGSRLRVLLALVLSLAALYGAAVYAPIPLLEKWRSIYIETALSTMSHQWLATMFFPKSVVDRVKADIQKAQASQDGLSSEWSGDSSSDAKPPAHSAGGSQAQQTFFDQFWELDEEKTLAWLDKHPDALENGWDKLYVNEAGLDDDGLDLYTTMGEQVLAIDAANGVLLVRVSGSGYRGVLAIAKDPARLSLQAASSIGSNGQNAGVIADAHNGVLAMTASGFSDEGGHGSGGIVNGYALCDGVAYGKHFRSGYKRAELHSDDRLYITDATAAVSDNATDAMEFTPALIIDGKIVVDGSCGWTAINPRACIGQSDRHEILMLVIEGRLTSSLGVDVIECAKILARHNAMQAMNVDGGTSAILYYDGEYVTRCSNTNLSAGRQLPDAWVYARTD